MTDFISIPASESQGIVEIPFTMFADPVPAIGDAVHLDVANMVFQKATACYRNNVVGILDADGRIISSGLAMGLTGLTPKADYFLKAFNDPFGFEQFGALGSLPTNWAPIRTTAIFEQAQSFKMAAGRAAFWSVSYLKTIGSPTYDLFFQIRASDKTTVLAESEHFPASDIGTPVSYRVVLTRWFDLYRSDDGDAVLYLVLCADTSELDDYNYVEWGYYTTGDEVGYADGDRWSSDGTNWTEYSDDDLSFYINLTNLDVVDPVSGIYPVNISSTHPFETDEAPYTVHHPMIKVGRAITETILDVSIKRISPKILIDDPTTVISESGSDFKIHPYGWFSGMDIEKALLLYKMGPTDSDWAFVTHQKYIFTQGVNNHQKLLFKMKRVAGSPNSTLSVAAILSGRESNTEEMIVPGTAVYVGRVFLIGT
jgi:hypothetical protein